MDHRFGPSWVAISRTPVYKCFWSLMDSCNTVKYLKENCKTPSYNRLMLFGTSALVLYIYPNVNQIWISYHIWLICNQCALFIFGAGNCFPLNRYQTVKWTNADILLIGPSVRKDCEIWMIFSRAIKNLYESVFYKNCGHLIHASMG